jgi:predicted nuclease with TOPRIM domain
MKVRKELLSMQGTNGIVQFIFEHIELLWIIPVVAFAFFIFLIQLTAQRREEHIDLSREVTQFNAGGFQTTLPELNGAARLNQLERAISAVTDSLSNQQRTIEQFHRDNTTYNSEIGELKNRLRELYKEYDIVLSENYSLRAKVKKLQGKQEEEPDENPEPVLSVLPAAPAAPLQPQLAKVDMKLYEDTKTLNLALLDDTSEMDLSDLNSHFDSR